jgi:hypothetical protein
VILVAGLWASADDWMTTPPGKSNVFSLLKDLVGFHWFSPASNNGDTTCPFLDVRFWAQAEVNADAQHVR